MFAGMYIYMYIYVYIYIFTYLYIHIALIHFAWSSLPIPYDLHRFPVKSLFPSLIFRSEEEATALEGLKLTENALSTAQKVDPPYRHIFCQVEP